jgi:Fur family zinc uptake transcriptional regulator
MAALQNTLTPHCQKVLATLERSAVPLTAYALLDKLRKHGFKAPPTIYRALESLVERGLVHRIESLGAFVACHHHENGGLHSQFLVCRDCGSVEEVHDQKLTKKIHKLASSLKFHIEREILEIMGLCKHCSEQAKG